MNDKVFIICVELNSLHSITTFENMLRFLGNYQKILPNIYAIKRSQSETSTSLKNYILQRFSNNCQIFIIKSSIDASWNLPINIDSWLKTNI